MSETPVFFIDSKFNVYPNTSTPSPQWLLGNLMSDGAETILENYTESRSRAQQTRLNVPLCELVLTQGDPTSQRLFLEDDYIELVLNRYCRGK